MNKTMASLFTGGALFDIGAEAAGFKHVWGIELDPKIAQVANDNGFRTVVGDVREKRLQECVPDVDHIHASPPCPNYSVAKNGGGETETDLELADAVCCVIDSKLPETFSLENVSAYRKSEALKRIMRTLTDNGYMVDIQNLNAADFGVPQTRKRMILRAKRNALLSPYPDPVKWVGWYKAVEDILDTLPESEFAPWQIARLPKEYKEFILGNGSRSEAVEKDKPAPTITSNRNQKGVRAFVLNGSNVNSHTYRPREAKEPHHTVTASFDKTPSRAFVVSGGSAGKNILVRDGDEPIFTIKSNNGGKEVVRAKVGRVVKMTIQALGRFQTVPDWYKGLTIKINGNGVPCLMAEGIMRTFRAS